MKFLVLATAEGMSDIIFTNFGKVSCLLNRLIGFSISRIHMLQGVFEYVCGNLSFSQSNKIKLLKSKVM